MQSKIRLNVIRKIEFLIETKHYREKIKIATVFAKKQRKTPCFFGAIQIICDTLGGGDSVTIGRKGREGFYQGVT